MAAMTDWLENKLIDWMFRGQTFTQPTSIQIGLFTSPPNEAGGGTEVSGNGYSRASLACSLLNWAGTQADGSTTTSSGTSGTTSNNAVITFPTPTGPWGLVTHFVVYDQSLNRLFWGALATGKNIFADDPVTIQPALLSIRLDD